MNIDTITAIYNAAVTPVAWNDVIDRCVRDTHAFSGAFTTYDVSDPGSYSVQAMGKPLREAALNNPNLIPDFIENIAPLEIAANKHIRQFAPRTIISEHQYFPDPTGAAAQTHYKWLKDNLDVGAKLLARLNNNPRIHDMFILQFSDEQSIYDSSRPTFTQLLPHLAKSAEMSVLYSTLQQHYAAVLSVLDKVGMGLCILDTHNNVIVSNTEANRIFDAGHGLRINNNRTMLCSNNDDQAQLINAINAAQLQSPIIKAESLLAVRRSPSDHPLLIEVSPLRDTLDELNFGLGGVLVQLVDTESREHCSVDAFAIAYELTQAEQSVTEFLLDGLTNREIAEERSTSVDTVKSQISRVMDRTQTRSRVELVRCVLKTQMPVFRDKE